MMMTDCGSRVGQPDSAQWISDDDLNCVEQAITILQGWVEAADREHEIRLTAEHERDELADRVAALTAERDALRQGLAKTAVQPAAYHDGSVCVLCHAFNRERGPVEHRAGCLLTTTPPASAQEGNDADR